MMLIDGFCIGTGISNQNKTTKHEILEVLFVDNTVIFTNPYLKEHYGHKTTMGKMPIEVEIPIEYNGIQRLSDIKMCITFLHDQEDACWNDAKTWESYRVGKTNLDIKDDEQGIIEIIKNTISKWQSEHVLINQRIEKLSDDYYIFKDCIIDLIGGNTSVILYNSCVTLFTDNAYAIETQEESVIEILSKNAKIENMLNKTSIFQALNNTYIENMKDKSTIHHMCDNAIINNARNNAYIETMSNHAAIRTMTDFSKVKEMENSSIINYMWNNTSIGKMSNDTIVFTMEAQAHIDCMFDDAVVKHMKPDTKIKEIHDNVSILDMRKNTEISHVCKRCVSKIKGRRLIAVNKQTMKTRFYDKIKI